MKVVGLGAPGNAGNALLHALNAEPRVAGVVAVARRLPHDWHSPNTVWRALDVATDPLEPVVRGAEVVVHLAWLIQPARDLEQCRAVNVNGSGRVIGAVAQARVPTLVYAEPLAPNGAGIAYAASRCLHASRDESGSATNRGLAAEPVAFSGGSRDSG